MNDKSIRVIYLLLVACFLNDLYSLHLFLNRKSNFLFYNLYFLAETIVLYYFFYKGFLSKIVKKILLVLLIVFLSIWFRQLIRFGTEVYFNDLVTAETVSVVVLSLIYYYEQIIKNSSAYIYVQSKFWIVSAYFIYFAGTFFLILYLPYLNRIEQENYYFLTYIFTIIRTILLCIALSMKAVPSEEKVKLI